MSAISMNSGDDGSEDAFCHGGGMIMYMKGFKFTFKGNEPCLNLFFSNWTLSSKGKLVGAMIGIFVFAIFVEGLSKLRQKIVRAAKQVAAEQDQLQQAQYRTQPPATTMSSSSPSSSSSFKWNPSLLRLSITILHGVQAFLGYILMLATMTFSLELLFSVVLGLAVGYAIFFQTEDALNEKHVTSNPCCNFMEEEAREIRSQVTQRDDENSLSIPLIDTSHPSNNI